MSEFSEAYYLRSDRQEEVVQLLERAGVEGYIYPALDGWVAFTANTSPLFRFSEKLKAVNTGILLQYVNAEDHGWGFELCVSHESVCGYYCMFKEEPDTENPFQITREIEENDFEKLLEENGEFQCLKRYFDEKTAVENICDVYDFTRDMKLYFSEWISYQYAQLQNGEMGKYGDYENLTLVKVG